MANNYNPDVLNCIANLSNDEVFTPPALANQVLDLLPQELFRSPKTTFLDPFTKSGVFLREIVKRLDRGLESQIPDRQERIDHIMHKQVFGIACTELTAHLSRRSLYCSKHPDGKHSVSHFDNPEGHIQYKALKHTWENGKCKYCGASKSVYDRSDASEQYAYQFIHTDKPDRIFNMTFDVVIGNPPYQLNDGGGTGSSAIPLYHKFVEQAKKLAPRYLCMIIPSRWYSGGKGLDDFRETMIRDTRICKLVDYFDSTECFPGVDISGGICYFLWQKDYRGNCEVKTIRKGRTKTLLRPLLLKGCDSFIRFNEAISIVNKVLAHNFSSFSDKVSPRKPFGDIVPHRMKASNDEVKVYAWPENGFIKRSEIKQNHSQIAKYKVFIAKAYGERGDFPYLVTGKPFIGEPSSCCTETYLVLGTYENQAIAENVVSYVKTKLFRFLVLLKKNTQNAAKGVYTYVPSLDFSHPWTDEMLYDKYGINEEEIAFIDSMVRPMD